MILPSDEVQLNLLARKPSIPSDTAATIGPFDLSAACGDKSAVALDMDVTNQTNAQMHDLTFTNSWWQWQLETGWAI